MRILMLVVYKGFERLTTVTGSDGRLQRENLVMDDQIFVWVERSGP